MILTAVVALTIGVVVGVALSVLWARRSAPVDPVPAVPAALRPERPEAAPSHLDSERPAEPTPSADGEPAPVTPVLADAVDHLEIGVMVMDSDGRAVYRNAAASDSVGTHIGVIVDDHVADTVKDTRDGGPTQRVVELQGPPKRWLEIAAEPMPDGRAVVTIRDVTDRVRTDAMRTDFVTNISHELKTPVGAVAVLAEALIDETDPEVVQRLADHLVDESHRAVRTIDDLLKLSQIESSRPGDTVVELGAVVQSAIARGRIVDGGRGVQIQTVAGPEAVYLRADERQLISALGNLVENAVKYSHAGDVVQIRTRVDDNAVEIMVADQGVGIPARDLDRIFERFYRVDKARSRETGGTGLGLAIVRHVATNHGGDVLVSSQEGEGSTFVLRLPAGLVVSDEHPTTSRSTSPASGHSTSQETPPHD